MPKTRLVVLLALSVAGLALAACERQTISSINADPGRFMNRDINVAGQVTQSIGASVGNLGGGVYQIDDGTGKLWVFVQGRSLPNKGAYVGARGKMTPTVNFMGVSYPTVLKESDRRAGNSDTR